MDEATRVLDRWTPAEEDVLPAIWCGLNGENP
jgi:hypothetical protein